MDKTPLFQQFLSQHSLNQNLTFRNSFKPLTPDPNLHEIKCRLIHFSDTIRELEVISNHENVLNSSFSSNLIQSLKQRFF